MDNYNREQLEQDEYSFTEHLHRYAIWTAARAVARGFTRTKNVKKAIEVSNLKDFRSRNISDNDQFNEYHKCKAHKIIGAFEELKVKCSYGQASKIIAIYLKTFVLLSEGEKSVLSYIFILLLTVF